MDIDARQIAERLGVTEQSIHRLRSRGYLHTLDVTDAQIRWRLYGAAQAYALRSGSERGHRRARRREQVAFVGKARVKSPTCQQRFGRERRAVHSKPLAAPMLALCCPQAHEPVTVPLRLFTC